MSYIINKTDGSVLTEVVDGTVDQTTTDITLVGKNSTSYGEFLNENFIKILENFANTNQPNNPIAGQLWFDTSENRLKVYDGNGFKVSGGTIVSTTQPSTFAQGDIWIDSKRRQLYFHDGVGSILAGPGYTAQQGVSEFITTDAVDVNGNSHTVTEHWLSGQILGVWSLDVFVPVSLGGLTQINVGFNPISGIKYNGTADSADKLIDGLGNIKTADNFLNTGDDNGFQATSNTLVLTNTRPLRLGAGGNSGSDEVVVTKALMSINSTTLNQNFQISLLNSLGTLPSFYINGSSQFVGISTNTPTATLDVNGDTRIRGDLTVEGTTTTINTTNTVIQDKLIELGVTESPDDTTANGGGIALKGTVDKTITYSNSVGAWSSSENFNLSSGKAFFINGLQLLNSTTLSTSVTDAQGLRRLGILDSVRVSKINIATTVISVIDDSNPDSDLVLLPQGTAGTVSVSSKRISNLEDPLNTTDAVNLQSMTAAIAAKPVGLSADVTGLTDTQIATNIIEKVYPASEHTGGTCRIWCTNLNQAKIYTVITGAWTGGSLIP